MSLLVSASVFEPVDNNPQASSQARKSSMVLFPPAISIFISALPSLSRPSIKQPSLSEIKRPSASPKTSHFRKITPQHQSEKNSPKHGSMSEIAIGNPISVLMESTETDTPPNPRKIAPLKKSRFQNDPEKATESDHKMEEETQDPPQDPPQDPQPQEDMPKKTIKKMKYTRPRPGDNGFDPFLPYTPSPSPPPLQIIRPLTYLPPRRPSTPLEERDNWKKAVEPDSPTPTPERELPSDEPKLFMTPPASSSETLSSEDDEEGDGSVSGSLYEFFGGICRVCRGFGCDEHDTEEEEEAEGGDGGSIICSADGSSLGSGGSLKGFVTTDPDDDSEDTEFGLDGSDDEEEEDSEDSLEEELSSEEDEAALCD